MTSANERYQQWMGSSVYEPTIDWIREIQLDAMKEGARRAAEIVNAYPQTFSIIFANKNILTTADRWTIKDL